MPKTKKKTKKTKLVHVQDPNDGDKGSVGVYEPDDFRAWVHEVFLEGYKRKVRFPSLSKAVEIVEAAGCKVDLNPKVSRVAIIMEIVGDDDANVCRVIDRLLDDGVVQEAIRDREDRLAVTTAFVRPEPK